MNTRFFLFMGINGINWKKNKNKGIQNTFEFKIFNLRLMN